MGKAKLDFCRVDRHPASMKTGGFLKLILLWSVVFQISCSNSFFSTSRNFPPGTISGDFPDYDHLNSSTPTTKKLPSELLIEATELLESIFLVEIEGDYKCIDPGTFQKFIEMFFRTEQGVSPTLDYLCMFKKSQFHEHELRWVLSETKSHVWTLLPPTGLVDVDMKALKSISVDEESSIKFEVVGQRSTIFLNGFKFNLSKYAVEGTPLQWVPEYFLRFDVDKIEITDDGKYLVKLIIPLGFPISIKGQVEVSSSKGKLRLSF